MSELIARPEYLQQLIKNKDVNLVKIVTGIRRCGKSSLLDLFHQYLNESGVSDDQII
jgi:hypothetical protein